MHRPTLRYLVALPILALALTATACGTSSPAGTTPTTGDTGTSATAPAKIGGTLTMYTPNEQNMLDALLPAFTDATGITVNTVTAGTGELYTRITNEVANPQGDVLFGGGVAQAMSNSDLWEPYVGANDGDMTGIGKNVGGFSTPYQADGSVLMVNTDKIGDITINGYADLLNPALKGKIAFGDPTNSSSAFAQLTNMLAAMGGQSSMDANYTSDAGWQFVQSLLNQTGGQAIGSSNEVGQSTANGEYTVALTYEPLASNFVQAGQPVKIIYPSEGAVFLPSGVEIIKGAKNMAQAQAFCDWIQSEQAQQIIADQTNGRPLRPGIVKQGVPLLSDIKTLQEDSTWVSANRDTILSKYQAALANVS
ncbi:MAG: extracellular solute-binding protein [Propionibacteriaceae bacterium]|nr:extracellular solute-binding protein [Propionibacteriaceae bacterium]